MQIYYIFPKVKNKINFFCNFICFFLSTWILFSNFAAVIQLTRHIEILLLSNDCVIVPGLGGFVTHKIDARYDEEDCMFIPPLRILGFNPQLQINDSLLAVSYVEAFDISYPEAVRMIEAEVEEIKQTIATEGVFEMNNIGCLYHNMESGYIFEPCEAGVLTPELYGLSSFEFGLLQAGGTAEAYVPPVVTSADIQKKTEDTAAQTDDHNQAATDDEQDDDSNYIHINTSWIRNAMLGAAALFIAVMFITPRDTADGYRTYMSAWSSRLMQKLMPKDTNCETIKIHPYGNKPARKQTVKTPLKKAGTPAVADTTGTDTAVHKKPAINKDKDEAEKPHGEFYSIVLASSITHRNAESYTELLKGKGFKDVSVYDNGNITRVIYGKFQSESNAKDSLRKLRDSEDFKEAWVLKIKTDS